MGRDYFGRNIAGFGVLENVVKRLFVEKDELRRLERSEFTEILFTFDDKAVFVIGEQSICGFLQLGNHTVLSIRLL